MMRELLAKAVNEGLVTPTGLTAHGRGEAFDYLLGERTIAPAKEQARVAAALLLTSEKPVISTNGNSTVLAPKEIIELSEISGARMEVNLFHPSLERVGKLVSLLEDNGAEGVLGLNLDAVIPGMDHNRANCESRGIYAADTVLVLLEDGDRTEALKRMGKTLIAVDLNPLSRTAKESHIPIIDNVIRALPNITGFVREMKNYPRSELMKIVDEFNPKSSLELTVNEISICLRNNFKSD